jgi:hypothetical protein
MIEAAAPKDEIDGALAVQMACTHTVVMAVLAKLDVAFATERHVAAPADGITNHDVWQAGAGNGTGSGRSC